MSTTLKHDLRAPIIAALCLAVVGAALFLDAHLQSHRRGGHSLASSPGAAWITLAPAVPVGQEFAAQFFDLTNQSRKEIVLRSFDPRGPGVGTVIRVLRVAIVDLATDISDGIFHTYPPTEKGFKSNRCVVARPVAVDGFVLRPHQTVRALVLFRVVRPGTLNFRRDDVTYITGGHVYSQTLHIGITLRAVAVGGKPNAVVPGERKCAHLSHLLPTGAAA